MNDRFLISAAALILLPGLALAQVPGGSPMGANPSHSGNSSMSSSTPPDVVKSPHAYQGRSSGSTMSNEQVYPYNDMHSNGPASPSALDAARDDK